jgi:hypothetical protein
MSGTDAAGGSLFSNADLALPLYPYDGRQHPLPTAEAADGMMGRTPVRQTSLSHRRTRRKTQNAATGGKPFLLTDFFSALLSSLSPEMRRRFDTDLPSSWCIYDVGDDAPA